MSEHQKRMKQAAAEMEAQEPEGEGAPHVHRADVGFNTGARVEGVTTSAKILHHDKPYEQLRNRHPNLESVEIEQLLEHALGMSVYEAARAGYPTPNKEKLDWLLTEASHEDVERLLDGDEEDS